MSDLERVAIEIITYLDGSGPINGKWIQDALSDALGLKSVSSATQEVSIGYQSVKAAILEKALEIVTGPRQQLYGHPSQNFIDTAEIMSAYLHARGVLARDVWLQAYDVAILIACLKTARIATSPHEPDHWVDLAGYAACGGEAADVEL